MTDEVLAQMERDGLVTVTRTAEGTALVRLTSAGEAAADALIQRMLSEGRGAELAELREIARHGRRSDA